jgi:hypothetical protein
MALNGQQLYMHYSNPGGPLQRQFLLHFEPRLGGRLLQRGLGK